MKGGLKIKFNNRGIAVILLALGILVLVLAFASLGIDIAYMYNVKNGLQVSGDSAALAGAALITDENDLVQTTARNTAIDYAAKNEAAGTSVELASDGSNVLSADNDVTVGFWDATSGTYTAGVTPVNAIEVRPRRTADSPGGQVRVFWGQILSFFGKNWSLMSAAARSVAVRETYVTPGISLCVMSCGPPPVTGDFIVNTDKQQLPIANGMAWTVFDCNASVNANDVEDFIWGRKSVPSPLCGRCIATQNGVSALTGKNGFATAFASTTYDRADKTVDAEGNVTSWKVAVPIIDYSCNTFDSGCSMGSLGSSGTCPPGVQGMSTTEPSHVSQLAVITITAVTTTGDEEGITVSDMQCIDCSSPIPLGNRVKLVK